MHCTEFVAAILLVSGIGIINAYKNLNKGGCTEKSVSCPCGKSKTQLYVEVKVKACPIQYKGDLGTRCEPCLAEAAAACEKFKNCDFCPLGNDGPTCWISPKKKSSFGNETRIRPDGYPLVVRLPPGKKNRKTRLARNVDGCDHEFKFETAEVVCKIWPDHVRCEETCIHGYELNGKNTRVSKCKSSSPHYWYPDALEECQEASNCHPMLVTPGEMKCFTHTMHPPHCTISCESYDRHPATSPRSYHCSQGFDPPLPHCAKLNPTFDKGKKS